LLPSSYACLKLAEPVFRTKRRRILLVIALVAAAVGVAIYVALSARPLAATAADGRVITIERVSFGTHHRFTQGKWWVRVLKPIMGARWAALRGCYETRFTNDVPALLVWTRWEAVSRSNTVAVEATIADERGTESELVLNRWNAVPGSFGGGSQPARVAWLFNNFPRRSNPLRLRIYDRDQRYIPTQAVEIAFSNPARKRISQWQGSELPLTIKTNNTEFVLTSVQQTSNALWRLNFLVRTNGVLDPSWLVGGITALSASGNVLTTRSNLAATAATNLTFHLRGALWPEETVWRFAAEFVRIADFQPGDLWMLTNIAIPHSGTPFEFTTNLTAHSALPINFHLQTIPREPPFRRSGMRGNANIYVQFEDRERQLLLAEAMDDRNRRVQFEVDLGAPRMIYGFGLAIPEGAQAVNLTFALRKFVTVHFHVLSMAFSRTNAPPDIDTSEN
jgi:hypothetical protein